MFRSFCLIVLPILLGQTASAQILSTFVREQVGSLPRGRFMVSVVGVNASIDRMYDQSGIAKPLSDQLNRQVTFQKITQEESVRGNQLAGLFLSNGMKLDDAAGSVRGVLTGTVSGKVPVVGYGITDTLGVFLSLPVIEFNIQTRYEFVQSESTRKLMSHLQNSNQQSVAREFDAAFKSSLENKLYKTGYTWNPALNRTYLGDAQITFLKYLDDSLQSGRKYALQPFLVLPTANDRDLRDVYGLKAGDRRFGLGFKAATESRLVGNLQGNFSVSGLYLFSAQQGRRLPINADDDLNELQDDHTQVSGGTRLTSQAQLRYPFPRWAAVNLGLNWQCQLRENLEGDVADAIAYQLASEKSGYQLWSAYASLDLNSIPSFLNGEFLIPVIAEAGVGIPLYGRNAIAEPVFQIQGTLFF